MKGSFQNDDTLSLSLLPTYQLCACFMGETACLVHKHSSHISKSSLQKKLVLYREKVHPSGVQCLKLSLTN